MSFSKVYLATVKASEENDPFHGYSLQLEPFIAFKSLLWTNNWIGTV